MAPHTGLDLSAAGTGGHEDRTEWLDTQQDTSCPMVLWSPDPVEEVSWRSWRSRTCGPGETNIWFLLVQVEVLTVTLKQVLVLNFPVCLKRGVINKFADRT